MTRATGNPHGPKPKELTPAFIFGCGKIMCTQEEIGDLCGLSQPQVCARIKDDPELEEAYRRGQATAKQSLRRVQFKNALAGNVVAGIWLGKQHLGMSDKAETHDVHDVNVNVQYIAKWGKTPAELGAAPLPNDPDVIEGELDPGTSDPEDPPARGLRGQRRGGPEPTFTVTVADAANWSSL